MRDTVDKILGTEAERLLAKAKLTGLDQNDLSFLDKLISTHKNFIGESPSSDKPAEVPPEKQSTASLLDSLSTPPTSVSETSK